jgi:eukaryotic-like serine/threonine-protein kinase
MANREQEIFWAALERTTESERSAYLDTACAGLPQVRARVEALLQAASAAAADGFMDGSHAIVHETSGARIGRYVLRDRIGEGGFGVVYLAEQEQPVRRDVALKIIKLGMDTRAVIARFEAERQALAMMNHANIARVFDAGATETGRPYFVMELVRGAPITTFCDDRRLEVHERLQLFLQVCRAVHHAHQKGVIHRDLKPSNILIALEGDLPTAKVIDFGIAKATAEPLTEKTLLSRLHGFVGTPAYMSPEQVGLGDLDIDVRSDIYSLGALLYELLAGFPVLDTKALLVSGYAEIQRVIHHQEPPPLSQRVALLEPEARLRVAAQRRSTPSRLVAELRGDLDRIVGKCLEKDRARRYETTEELAQDLIRFLRSEPVLARPATLRYRAAKFVRRHRRGVVVGVAVMALLASLGIYHVRRLADERDRAQLEAKKAAKVSEVLTELLMTGDPFRTPSGAGPGPTEALEASAERVRREFASQPEVEEEILGTIGRVYLRLGQHDKARPILEEAAVAGRATGRPDARLAQTLNDLGVLCRERGDFSSAIRYGEEALALRRLLGSENNDVAVTLSELGRAHSGLEQYDQAEQLFRESLAIRQRVLGAEDRETATSLGDLGVGLWQKGDLAAAEPLLQQSLAIHRKVLGPKHPNVGGAMANLAQLKIDQNEIVAAELLLREAVEIIRGSLGAQHWRTASVMTHLGTVWRLQGRTAEAAALLDEALQIAHAALGNAGTVVASLEVERARVYLARGEHAAAEAMLREALKTQRSVYAETSWRISTTKSLLGAALLGQGRNDEAATLLLEASRVLKDIPGPQGRETKATQERLAMVQRAQSKN